MKRFFWSVIRFVTTSRFYRAMSRAGIFEALGRLFGLALLILVICAIGYFVMPHVAEYIVPFIFALRYAPMRRAGKVADADRVQRRARWWLMHWMGHAYISLAVVLVILLILWVHAVDQGPRRWRVHVPYMIAVAVVIGAMIWVWRVPLPPSTNI